MYIFKKQNKKTQKNCDLLPCFPELSPSLSLSFPSQTNPGKERKGGGGGAMLVDSWLTGELVADLDLSGFTDPRSNGPAQFCFVMSSLKSLAAYLPTKR